MERTMSVEEKIKRAEEIYNRRKGITTQETKNEKLHVNEEPKDVKLLKKMIIQIIICGIIYGTFYIIQNNQFIFSEDFLNKTKEILSYDTNFQEIYEKAKNAITTFNQEIINKKEEKNQQENNEQNSGTQEKNQAEQTEQSQQTSNENEKQNEGIGGAEEEKIASQTQELTQEQQDINNVKNTTTFIKPIEGKISSTFGYRETATGTVPKNHTGTDIAANTGTKIKSATEGEVAIIYAHCNQLYVKQGDHITQGQEIAEVGTTGNSTGPHLHFEIRYQERLVDPQKILEI